MNWFCRLLVTLALTVATPTVAHACSCVRVTPEQLRADAAAIFYGRVQGTRPSFLRPFTHEVVGVEVSRAWRGVSTGTVWLAQARWTSCYVPVARGEEGLFYVPRDRFGLIVHMCWPGAQGEDAERQMAALGPPLSRRFAWLRLPLWTPWFAFGSALLAVLLFWRSRRRRAVARAG